MSITQTHPTSPSGGFSGRPIAKLSVPSFDYAGQTLVRDIDLKISPGQTVCLMGPSGTGKSTLLRLMAGLIPLPQSAERLVPLRSTGSESIALLAQDTALFPWLTVMENIYFGDTLRGLKPNTSRAEQILESVQLSEKANTHPYTLSGGMKQRIALARTMYEDADLILLDEPFSALDTLTKRQIISLSQQMLNDKTVFLVTHDPLEALLMADEIYLLEAGQLVRYDHQNFPEKDTLLIAENLVQRLLEGTTGAPS